MMHIPVLVDEVLEILAPKEGGVYVDATLGGGGHSLALLERIGENGKVIGLDKDGVTIAIAKERLPSGMEIYREDFVNMKDVVKNEKVDGIIFDLGLSSFQLEDRNRGFSYTLDGSLDMRIDTNLTTKASDILNRLSEEEIVDIFKKFGEERNAKKIAKLLDERKKKKPILTTGELVSIIKRVTPRRRHRKTLARIFQSLRIYVNDELNTLEKGLKEAVKILKVEGRLCVISYHSLEDRIVKNFFRELDGKKLRILTPKPLRPTRDEIERNRKSRSAKLRGAERL